MNPLIISKKTGFVNVTPSIPVIIRDFRGMLFYSTVGLKIVKCFNLPAGNYFVESGKFEPLKSPVSFPVPELPKPERKYKMPSDYAILFGDNPNKCTIKWGEKVIIFDNDLKQKTLPELFFILYHEFGHHLYFTEKYADLFAARYMLKKGYNPSQIGKAPITSLSHYQFLRKKFIVKKMTK